jgi:sialidase-1
MSTVTTEEIWDIEAPGSGYVGWPTLTCTQDGTLHLVYSGGRQHHVCPFGQVHLMTSVDEGKTWTWPRALVDGILDDRDAGIIQTSKGTLIVNWFSSLTWERIMSDNASAYHAYPETEKLEWQRRSAQLTDAVRQSELGIWSIRSSDGGATWSPKVPTQTGSPHGPCELNDGRLLYVGKKLATNFATAREGAAYAPELGAAQSTDDGQSWEVIGDIPIHPEHQADGYHELHAVQAADGTIIAHIRNHNELHHYETLQTESHDGGRTWTMPHSIGLWGYPAFLLRTSDGRLITTVGHRRDPLGNQISLSEDNGQSWSPALPINTDSQGDFGYPSTVELSPGRFLSLWYDKQNGERTSLRLARWTIS